MIELFEKALWQQLKDRISLISELRRGLARLSECSDPETPGHTAQHDTREDNGEAASKHIIIMPRCAMPP